MRPIPQIAVDFVAAHEGVRLSTYLDSVNVPTQGFGHTGPDVKMGQTITLGEAKELLAIDLEKAASRIEGVVQSSIIAALSENQYAALLSFVLNVGAGPKWAIWKVLAARQFDKVPEQLQRFVFAGGKRLPGLVNRRTAEAALWASSLPAKPPVPVIGPMAPAVAVLAPAAILAAHSHSSFLPAILGVSLALAIAGAVVLWIKSKKADPMPSQQFQDALTNLLAAKDSQASKMVADAVAPLNAKIAELEAAPAVTDTGPQVDADDTAAVVAATPTV